MLQTMCADKAILFCDDSEAGPVDYAMVVWRTP
jgi:hypothetical protein